MVELVGIHLPKRPNPLVCLSPLFSLDLLVQMLGKKFQTSSPFNGGDSSGDESHGIESVQNHKNTSKLHGKIGPLKIDSYFFTLRIQRTLQWKGEGPMILREVIITP